MLKYIISCNVNYNNDKISIPVVLFIESQADYVKLHLPDNIVVEGETMSDIEAKLPQNDFIRVHRSYLVSGIESFPNDYIEIKRKQILIIRSYKKEVQERLEME